MSGYDQPNYTQIPNVFLDRQMQKMTSLAELKVAMAVMRQTFGWQKKADQISMSQLVDLTGLSRPSVIEGVKLALKHGIIDREKRGNSFSYWLVVKKVNQEETASQEPASKESKPETVKKINQQVVKQVNPQKKEEQKKERNPTGGKGTLNPVAVENRTQSQLLTDDFCRRLRATHKVRLEQDQYEFHLGSFRNMLAQDEPTDEEIDRVIAHMVAAFPSAPKIRATKALQDVRLERDTGEAWNKPAPWEEAQEERREKSYYEKKYPTQPQKLPKELAALAEENRRLEAEMLKDVS